MSIRIDYHFHPNLSSDGKRANSKCKDIWQRFKKKRIDAVIITEHAYKNPKKAYEMMKSHRPEGFFCFPGVECISREGVDMVVFSLNENIYNYNELKAFQLSYFDLIEFINSKDDLYAYVTHPYTLGFPSVIKKLGKKAYFESLNLLGAIEISNGGFDNLLFLLNTFPFRVLLKSKIKKINYTKNLPKSDYPSKIKFVAVGSDAHHVEEIGNCYEIDYSTNAIDKERVFELIINNGGKGKIINSHRKEFSMSLLLKAAMTSFSEFMTKKSKF